MSPSASCKACRPLFWRHADGWDVYPHWETYIDPHTRKRTPRWFDGFIVEDAPTRDEAVRLWQESHLLGYCIPSGRFVKS